MKQRH